MINEAKTGLLVLVPLLLAMSGAHTSDADPGLIAPSITVSDAIGTNPGIVNTGGQSQRTVEVAWNAGSDYQYCEIYFTVNGANQTELGRGHDGARPVTMAAGNAYHFWMVVYPGAGQVRVVTELRVVAEQRVEPVLPPPPPPSGADAGPGISDMVSDRDPVRVYQNPIKNVSVDTGPTAIMIRFNGPPNQMPYVAIGRGPAITRNNELVFGDNLVAGGVVGPGTVTDAEKAAGKYLFASAHGTTLGDDGLEPDRTYYYIINVSRGVGQPPHQVTGQFKMMGERTSVNVVFDRVIIEDDSDDLSTGEVDFWFWANYGQPGGKIAYYSNGDVDSGHTYDLSRTIVIENAPTFLSLSASGRENDSGFGNSGFTAEEDVPTPLSGPTSRTGLDENVAKGDFDLRQYATGTRVPFRLNSMPGGSLKFVILGHFDVTRATATPGSSGNIGTTSSGLTTAPAPEPIRAQGRIRTGTTQGPTRSTCELARIARERNSPAAPGLEEKCRAEGAVKAQGRVRLPEETASSAAKASSSMCELAQRARARNSPAAPGLEAKCAAQLATEATSTTATGAVTSNRSQAQTETGDGTGATVRALQPENTIAVRVQYRKELGYKGDTGAFGYLGPTSCDAFSISVTPGDDSRPRDPYRISTDSKMAEAGAYYVCSYLVSFIPLDQAMTVSVSMSGTSSSGAWNGGGEAQPPAGQQRTILDATRMAMLNARQPRARLSYEMVYAPVVQR